MVSSGYLSLLYSVSKRPLEHWSKQCSKTGRVRKTLDEDLLENVVELQDLERSSSGNTFISCPACPRQLLDVRLPFFIIIMKNMNVECCFRIQIIDTNDIRHHFHFCNEGFESSDNIRLPVISRVKLKLESGWNRVEIDLENLTQRAFNSQYKATQRLAICANCRLRRVYFVDRHYADMEISPTLCQAFFHYYMMKWGIHLPKRMSRTDKSYSDVRMTDPATRQTNKDINDARQVNHHQFLKDLRLKSGKLINDFFRRTNSRLSDASVVKSKLRLMLFAVPNLRGKEMLAVAIRRNANRTSKRRRIGDASCCMTPTNNKTNSKGDGLESTTVKFADFDRMEVDNCKRKKNNSNVTLDDDWYFRYHPEEPSGIKALRMTPLPNEKRIQKLQKQDKLPLRNCKGSPSGKKNSLIVEKLHFSDKRAVKTAVSNAKTESETNLQDVVESFKGTLNAIRRSSDIRKPRTSNGTGVKLVDRGMHQQASFSKRNFTGQRRNLVTLRSRTAIENSHQVLKSENELGSVSLNKNCPKISKESEILRVLERDCQSVIREPLSLEIRMRTKKREKCGAPTVETNKIPVKNIRPI